MWFYESCPPLLRLYTYRCLTIYCKLELICEGNFFEFWRVFEITKNMIGMNLNGYIVIIAVINFCKNFSIAKTFPLKFPTIFKNSFQRKIIPLYSTGEILA